MARDIKYDNINELSVERILKLSRNSKYWKEYDESSINLIKKYNNESYRINEFRSYRLMVKNIANYIKKNMKGASPIKVCGFISSLIYLENTWFYPGYTFKYDDDLETKELIREIDEKIIDELDLDKEYELLNKKNELESKLVSTTDSYLCYGAEVARGRGCCRHLSSFFMDILFEAGYEVYRVGNSFERTNKYAKSLISNINSKYNCTLDLVSEKSNKCLSNHLCISFPYKDRQIMFDPTNVIFSVIEGYKANDIEGNYSYILDIPSVKRYNFLNFDELSLMLCRFYESNIGDLSSEEVNYEFKSGIREFNKVNKYTIDKHKYIREIFNQHSANRNIYKVEAEVKFLQKVLS